MDKQMLQSRAKYMVTLPCSKSHVLLRYLIVLIKCRLYCLSVQLCE